MYSWNSSNNSKLIDCNGYYTRGNQYDLLDDKITKQSQYPCNFQLTSYFHNNPDKCSTGNYVIGSTANNSNVFNKSSNVGNIVVVDSYLKNLHQNGVRHRKVSDFDCDQQFKTKIEKNILNNINSRSCTDYSLKHGSINTKLESKQSNLRESNFIRLDFPLDDPLNSIYKGDEKGIGTNTFNNYGNERFGVDTRDILKTLQRPLYDAVEQNVKHTYIPNRRPRPISDYR